MKLQIIDFVDCDYCEHAGIINNYVYEKNKKAQD